MSDMGTMLAGDITYSCDLFSEQTAQRMAGHYTVRTPTSLPGCLVPKHSSCYLSGLLT